MNLTDKQGIEYGNELRLKYEKKTSDTWNCYFDITNAFCHKYFESNHNFFIRR